MTNRPGSTLIVIFLKCKVFFFFPLVCNEPLWLAHHQKNNNNFFFWNIQHSPPQSWSIELLPFGTPLNRVWKFNFGSKKLGWSLWCYESCSPLGPKNYGDIGNILGNPSLGSYGNMVGGEQQKSPQKIEPTHTVSSQEKKKINRPLSLNFFAPCVV